MKVLESKVLLSVLKKADMVKNEIGLTLPGNDVNEGIEEAVVVEVGDEINSVKPGDKCFIYKGAGKEFTNPGDNQKYRVITKSEIIVIL